MYIFMHLIFFIFVPLLYLLSSVLQYCEWIDIVSLPSAVSRPLLYTVYTCVQTVHVCLLEWLQQAVSCPTCYTRRCLSSRTKRYSLYFSGSYEKCYMLHVYG